MGLERNARQAQETGRIGGVGEAGDERLLKEIEIGLAVIVKQRDGRDKPGQARP